MVTTIVVITDGTYIVNPKDAAIFQTKITMTGDAAMVEERDNVMEEDKQSK